MPSGTRYSFASMIGSPLLVAIILSSSCATAPSDQDGPTVESVQPAQGHVDAPVTVTIAGRDFEPALYRNVSCGAGGVEIDDTFAASMAGPESGVVDLKGVSWVDSKSLKATVPAGVEPGEYDLSLIDPRGRAYTLVGAYTALAASDSDTDIDSDTDTDTDVDTDIDTDTDVDTDIDTDTDTDTDTDVDTDTDTETSPATQCNDGLDNDGDMAVDFPDDPGCADSSDDDEFNSLPSENCADKEPGEVPEDGLVSGTTSAAGNDYEGSCGGDNQPETVYIVELPAGAAGLLVATDLAGTEFDTLIYVRDECDGPASEIDCDDDDGSSNYSMTNTGPLGPGTYFVFIDGAGNGSGGNGNYEASIQVMVDEGGACYPDFDEIRCVPELDCLLDTFSEHTCQPVDCTVEATYTDSFTATGSTVDAPNLRAGTCGQGEDGGQRGSEMIYVLDLAAGVSNVNASTANPGTDYDTLIYMRDGCTGTEIACDDDAVDLQSVIDSGPLAPGEYFIFVDSFGITAGNFELTVDVAP